MRSYLFKTYLLVLLMLPVLASAQVNANFTASATTGCNPAVINFTDLSSGNPTSWLWNFGNGNTSTLQHPSATFTTTGTFTVTLTVSNGSNSSTKTVTNYITIYPAPTVDFTVDDTSGCPPHPVNFTSQSTLNAPGAGTYFWNVGNGQTVNGTNPGYTYPNPGFYHVTHIVVNSAGCTTAVQKQNYIHVFTPPEANFVSTDLVLCVSQNNNATFVNTSTGTAPLSYEWDFGDGNTSTAAAPTHQYNATGTFSVRLIVTDGNGCKDTLVRANYVNVVTGQGTWNVPDSACVGTTLVFENTTPFTSVTNWDFGDGTTDTNKITTHTYTQPGTYNLTLSTATGACYPFLQKQVVIHPLPTVDFTANIQTPCPAPAPVQFTNLTVNGATYTWYFGDGGSSTQVNPLHTYQNNGYYDVTLMAESQYGCVATLVKPSYINIFDSHLSIDVSPGDGCIPVTDTFQATLWALNPSTSQQIPYPASITSYFWDFGDGNSSTQASPVHTYNNMGTYYVKLVVTTSNGCTDSASVVVNTGTPPIPDFTGPQITCVDQPVTFQNLTTNAISYTWYFGDGGTSADTDPTHIYSMPGTYSIMLIADNNGCKDTIEKLNYIEVKDPKAQFDVSYHCDDPLKVSFVNTSINYTSFEWFFGDGAQSTQLNPTHTYPALGNYTVSLVAFNSNTGCYDTSEQFLQFVVPQIDFLADDTAICPGNTINFSAMVSDTSFIVDYTWSFSNGTLADTIAQVQWWIFFPGFHDVSLITEDIHGCLDTVTKDDYILVGQPAANFTAMPQNVCVPGDVLFTSTSVLPQGTTPSTFEWNFGDGQTATTSNPAITHTYTSTGYYTVTMKVTDNIGCADSVEKLDHIQGHDPEADFSVNNNNACRGTPISFINNSSNLFGATFIWDFGDGTLDTATNPSHIYTQLGTFDVRMYMTDIYGCTDTMIKPAYITVWDRPDAAFDLSDTFRICPPLVVNFTNQSTGAVVYNWFMGDGSSFTTPNPNHVFVNSGLYSVQLVAINGHGCRDTATATVNLLGYDGALSYEPLTGCAPLTVTFKANVQNVPGFIWDFSDGTTMATTDSVVVHTYTEPGPFVPRVILTDNAGCSSSSQGLDTIKVDGIYAGFTYDPYPACEPGNLTFTDTSKGSYSTLTSSIWEFHDGQITTAPNPTKYYPALGDYIIKLYTETNTGCVDTLIDTLTFGGLPTIEAVGDTLICVGDSTLLQAAGGVSYTWEPVNALSCSNCNTPYAIPSGDTWYYVTGKDANGCPNIDSVLIQTRTHVVSQVGDGGDICKGESLQLTADGAVYYRWQPEEGLNDPTFANPVATPDSTTRYIMIAYEGSCIPDTQYVDVIVNPLPDIDAGPGHTIVAGESAQLQGNGQGYTSLLWDPVETLNCIYCLNPQASPLVTTTYKLTATNEFGCQKTDSVTVFVNCEASQIFMPNSFTPNNDGQNDVFYPRGKGIDIIRSFRIYSRWGELLFERRNIQPNAIMEGWDGTHNGVLLNPDVFIYVVDALCTTGEAVSWKGDISLIR